MTELAWQCTGGLLLALILVGGPVGCILIQNQQTTEAIKIVCAGEMANDGAKAITCQDLIRKIGTPR